MIEAVMIWNEPNNKSHWDLELDPEWLAFSRMTKLAGQAIAAEKSDMVRVLGGISPIDPLFIDRLARAFMRPQSAGSPDKRERRQLRKMKEGNG